MGELLFARRLTVPSVLSCIRLLRVPGSDLGLPVCDGAWRAPCAGGTGAASHAVSEAGRPTSQGRTPEDAMIFFGRCVVVLSGALGRGCKSCSMCDGGCVMVGAWWKVLAAGVDSRQHEFGVRPITLEVPVP